jgi:TetR/AcrR family transcriptional repressor of mexJK operon
MNATIKVAKAAVKAAAKAGPRAGARRPGRPTRSNEELLDLALELFLENGFERTSIDAITAAAGMAKRTVYLRYADKMTLFKAALQRAIEEWIVPVEQLRAAESDDLEQSLLSIGDILVTNIMSPAGLRLMRLTNAESGRMPDIGVYNYTEGTQPTMLYLADLFRRRIGADAISASEADEAAQAFLQLVVGGPASMQAWGVVLDRAAIDRHTRYSVHLFLHGLLTGKGDAAPDAAGDAAVEQENLRLKKLLAESMLKVSELQDRLGAA